MNQLPILSMPLQKFVSFTNTIQQNQRFGLYDLINLTSICLSLWQASYWRQLASVDHTIKEGEANLTSSYFANPKNYQRIVLRYGEPKIKRGVARVTRILFCATCRGNTSTDATINFTTTPSRGRTTHTKYTMTCWTCAMLGNNIGRKTSNG